VRRVANAWPSLRSGQSLIESCLAILLLCLIFAGCLQISRLLAAREILDHAAARGARAKTVGFNRWMVTKCVRVATIPNAGRLAEPEFENVSPLLREAVATMRPGALWSWVVNFWPASEQFNLERARIPEYLASPNSSRAHTTLDYSDWESVGHSTIDMFSPDPEVAPLLRVSVSQEYPLTNSLSVHRAFYAADTVRLVGTNFLENHYTLYLDDRYW